MKAKMTLMVTVPADWIAVSNSKETRFEDAGKDGYRVLERNEFVDFLQCYASGEKVSCYSFEETPRISTYLYAICAGPYHVF
jgi:hypothetical protein